MRPIIGRGGGGVGAAWGGLRNFSIIYREWMVQRRGSGVQDDPKKKSVKDINIYAVITSHRGGESQDF